MSFSVIPGLTLNPALSF